MREASEPPGPPCQRRFQAAPRENGLGKTAIMLAQSSVRGPPRSAVDVRIWARPGAATAGPRGGRRGAATVVGQSGTMHLWMVTAQKPSVEPANRHCPC